MRKILIAFLCAAVTFAASCAAETHLPSQQQSQPAEPASTGNEPPSIESETEEETVTKITVTAGDRTFSARLDDNRTAAAFADMLPLTLEMSELNGNEKYYYLDTSLPAAPGRPSGITAGDIMLYGSDCIVLFYESFETSYSYTPIGRLENAEGLAEALGRGGVTVAFTKGE